MSGVVVRQTDLELEAFERALRGVQGHYLPTRHATRTWRLCQADLDETTLTVAQEGGPNLYYGACAEGCFRMVVPLTRADHLAVNGSPLMRTRVAWLAPAAEFGTRSVEAARWLAIGIARQRVTRWLDERLVDDDFVDGNVTIATDAGSIHRIVALMRRMRRIDADGRGELDAPSVRDAVGRELTDAALCAVTTHRWPIAAERGRPRLNRQVILRRIAALIGENVDQPILIDDLCRAARVSSRTLHAVFIEQFGMSPHQYLMLSRMYSIHHALVHAEPTETVTDICGRFGVWDYGRFAQYYRRHFGRAPSQVRSAQGLTGSVRSEAC